MNFQEIKEVDMMIANSIEYVNQVKIKDDFWRPYMDVVRDEVIPYQWEALNDRIDVAPSHAIENFRIAAGESSGEFVGMVFQDPMTALNPVKKIGVQIA